MRKTIRFVFVLASIWGGATLAQNSLSWDSNAEFDEELQFLMLYLGSDGFEAMMSEMVETIERNTGRECIAISSARVIEHGDDGITLFGVTCNQFEDNYRVQAGQRAGRVTSTAVYVQPGLVGSFEAAEAELTAKADDAARERVAQASDQFVERITAAFRRGWDDSEARRQAEEEANRAEREAETEDAGQTENLSAYQAGVELRQELEDAWDREASQWFTWQWAVRLSYRIVVYVLLPLMAISVLARLIFGRERLERWGELIEQWGNQQNKK